MTHLSTISSPQLDTLIYAARQIIFELAEAVGPRRALLTLHSRIGDNIDGPALLHDTPEDLRTCRTILTDWIKQRMSDQAAIEKMATELEGQSEQAGEA